MQNLDPCKLLWLAIGVMVASFAYFFCVTFIPIPETGEDNAKYIVGFLVGTGVGSVITFYFRRDKANEPDPTKPALIKKDGE